jgi:hypothetical protein
MQAGHGPAACSRRVLSPAQRPEQSWIIENDHSFRAHKPVEIAASSAPLEIVERRDVGLLVMLVAVTWKRHVPIVTPPSGAHARVGSFHRPDA